MPAIAKAALGSKGYAEAGLFTHWAEIAGASLAASSLPVKLSFPRGKRDEGTLTVRCGGSAALELQHLAPSVLERINGHFGYRAVARLKIEQGAVSDRKVAPAAPAPHQPGAERGQRGDERPSPTRRSAPHCRDSGPRSAAATSSADKARIRAQLGGFTELSQGRG